MSAIQGFNTLTSAADLGRGSAEQNSLSESYKGTIQNNNISAGAFPTNNPASSASSLRNSMSPGNPAISRITPTANFPEVLYSMIMYCEREGYNDVISFFSHGRAFAIHRPRRFEKEFMPRFFFNMGKIASFHRQLNLYGFKRITEGPDNGGYWHRKFLRGRRDMLVTLKRKSTSKVKRLAQEQEEKNLEEINPLEFNNMPPISPCPGYAGVVNEGLPLTNIVAHHRTAYLPGSLLASDLNLNLGSAAARSVQDVNAGVIAATAATTTPHHLLQMVQQRNHPTSSTMATTHHHNSVQLAPPGAADFDTTTTTQSVGASTLLEAQAILERRELMLRQAEEARNNALANELHSYQAAQIMATAAAAGAPGGGMSVPRVLKIAASANHNGTADLTHHHPHHHPHQYHHNGGLIATTTTTAHPSASAAAAHHPTLADYAADLNGVLTSQHRAATMSAAAAPHAHRTTTTSTTLPQLITTTHSPVSANNNRTHAHAHALTIQEASYLRDINSLSSLQQQRQAAAEQATILQQHGIGIGGSGGVSHHQQMNIARSSHSLPRGLEPVVPGSVPQQHHIILTNAAAAPSHPQQQQQQQQPGSPSRAVPSSSAAAAASMDSQTRALLNLQAAAAAGVGPATVTSQAPAYATAADATRVAPVSAAADRAVGRSYFARFAGGRRSI